MNRVRLIAAAIIVLSAVLWLWGAYRRRSRPRMLPSVERLLRAQYQTPEPTPQPTPTGDIFDGRVAREGFEAIRAKAGGDVKVVELRLSPLGVTALVQDPKDENKVVSYLWRNASGEVEGPEAVTTFGSGKVADNIVDVSQLDWGRLPAMVREAKEKSGLAGGEAAMATYSYSYSVFDRGEPLWNVAVTSREGGYKSEFVEFDAKGKLKTKKSY